MPTSEIADSRNDYKIAESSNANYTLNKVQVNLPEKIP